MPVVGSPAISDVSDIRHQISDIRRHRAFGIGGPSIAGAFGAVPNVWPVFEPCRNLRSLGNLWFQESPLHAQEPVVEKRGGVWQIRLSLHADLPDGTIVQLRFLPELWWFREGSRALERRIPETLPAPRRARLKGGKAEIRQEIPALRRFRIQWSVDPEAQEDVKAPAVQPAILSVLVGPSEARLRALQEDLDRPFRLHQELKKLLDRMEEVSKASDPERPAAALIGSLNELRGKCARAHAEGATTAATDLLDAVASDAITKLSWLANKKVVGGGPKDDPAKMDDPDGDGVAPESGNGINRGNGNVDGISADLLRKRANAAPAIQRAESLLLLIQEARLEKADATALGVALEAIAMRMGESAPADAVKALRSAVDALKRGELQTVREILDGQEEALRRIP